MQEVEKACVRADETHLNSIFSNLIINAKDAIEESKSANGEIMVSVEQPGNQFVISVQDNGLGIPETRLNEIFEPFFSTKPTKGTGLGLSIVKRLVRLYNGGIDVKTEPNKGATFIVTLPESQNG